MKRFRANKQYIVWLNPEVYEKAGGYGNNKNCPIATAIKEQLGVTRLYLGENARILYGKNNSKSVEYDIVGGFYGPSHCEFVTHAVEYGLTVPVVLERIDNK